MLRPLRFMQEASRGPLEGPTKGCDRLPRPPEAVTKVFQKPRPRALLARPAVLAARMIMLLPLPVAEP